MTSTFILLLGLPGAGKGTLAQSLLSQFKCRHISCGDVFREHLRNRTPFGQTALKYIEAGQLTPDLETSEMFLAHLSAQSNRQDYIIEGYPRTITQARSLELHLRESGAALGAVIQLEVPKSELIKRVIDRRICGTCGSIYNLSTKLPKQAGLCDVDGEPLILRDDDRPSVAFSRMQLYEEKEKDVLNYFRSKSIFKTVDASDATALLAEANKILSSLLRK